VGHHGRMEASAGAVERLDEAVKAIDDALSALDGDASPTGARAGAEEGVGPAGQREEGPPRHEEVLVGRVPKAEAKVDAGTPTRRGLHGGRDLDLFLAPALKHPWVEVDASNIFPGRDGSTCPEQVAHGGGRQEVGV